MSERDRLAADLRCTSLYLAAVEVDRTEASLEDADLLIALGWTQLDEQRLARALARHMAEFEAEPESFDSLGLVAAAIAKAYREDAGQ